MEQLDSPYYHLEGFAEGDDGKRIPFLLIINHPEYEDGDIIFCRVECPIVKKKEFKIYGATEAQACELSFEFVSTMIEHQGLALRDSKGKNVSLPLKSSPQ